jgi:hypothetical protein
MLTDAMKGTSLFYTQIFQEFSSNGHPTKQLQQEALDILEQRMKETQTIDVINRAASNEDK